MIGGYKSGGGKACISQSLMVLHSYGETLQEDTLHFIISHKQKEKTKPLSINLLSVRAHSSNSDFE